MENHGSWSWSGRSLSKSDIMSESEQGRSHSEIRLAQDHHEVLETAFPENIPT
jgi:hypothetical protein